MRYHPVSARPVGAPGRDATALMLRTWSRRRTAKPGAQIVVNSTELVWVNGRELTVPDGAAQTADGPRIVARFTGPIASGWTRRIEAAGGRIEFWCPPYGACITLGDASAAERLAALPFVAGFVAYEEDQADRDLGRPEAGPGRHWLDVICFAK